MATKIIKIEKSVFYILIIYVIGINLTFSAWQYNEVVSILLIVLFSISIERWHNKYDRILFVLGALGGSLGEISAVNLGIWSYTNPFLLGIPLWLPFIWGETIVVAKKAADIFVQL